MLKADEFRNKKSEMMSSLDEVDKCINENVEILRRMRESNNEFQRRREELQKRDRERKESIINESKSVRELMSDLANLKL